MSAPKILEEFVGEAWDQIKAEHPLAAGSGALLAALADAMGYQAWRATRAYDHVEIVFGVRMRDGTAGYSVDFHDAPKGAPGRVTSIQISSSELREFYTKAGLAIEGES